MSFSRSRLCLLRPTSCDRIASHRIAALYERVDSRTEFILSVLFGTPLALDAAQYGAQQSDPSAAGDEKVRGKGWATGMDRLRVRSLSHHMIGHRS